MSIGSRTDFGVVTNENRAWEDSYRQRWQHDKIVRSTHGTNCTGSCSWKIYVKNGLVTWQTQQTDYPRTRPDMPNHEPRGCSRGASYSWYLYSGNRLKYPMMRARLVELWRAARQTLKPVDAWASIVSDPDKRRYYTSIRGRGGFVRTTWDEVTEIIAAANVYTIKKYGPDRVAGFSPIPAMSMVSYAAGTRYLSLLGGTCLSFYDWYCDLPPSSPQTWGEQTDVRESADWYNSSFLILWGSNVPQTRTPDAHFYTESRYKGTKSVVISPTTARPRNLATCGCHHAQAPTRLSVREILSPLADADDWKGSLIDFNVRAERMGWLPSSPQLARNPLDVARDAKASGLETPAYVAEQLKQGKVALACEDPDNPSNWPRNLFVWRSNLLGASGKGHEYFLKHLLGADNGVLNTDLATQADDKPLEVKWRDMPADGKLDLMVTIDFRMNTTGLFSDIVLPTATWYEKNDMNTTDMHPFIHPLTAAVDPVWEARSDWEIFKSIARKFSEVAVGELGVQEDVVLTPLLHDTPGELGQPLDVKDWKTDACDPIPGKTMPSVTVVERDYPNVYKRFTALGPLMARLGNGGKGIAWNTEPEVDDLRELNSRRCDRRRDQGNAFHREGHRRGGNHPVLAPETNGRVAVKAWQALGKITGRDHTHLALHREDERIRFRDIVAQPRKIISSPTWSGIESEKITYNAGWTNVHEPIPWRTLTGRQQLYQDHPWMRAFGESLCVYRPPIDTKTVRAIIGKKDNGNPEVVLNFITPHQKWGIHSTYTDNLLMLTLSRGGPIIWISEIDAKKVGIEDNDWVEAYNVNGALVARAVVSTHP